MTRRNSIYPVLLTLLLFYVGGCQSLQDVLNSVQKPTLSIQDVRLGQFSFQEMELIYEVVINNPNTVALQMQDYSYRLDVNDEPFLDGDQKQGLEIKANGSSIVEVPLTVNFQNLFTTIQGITEQDASTYDFQTTMAFNLPVLGRTEVPVSKKGTIPIIKRPVLNFQSLEIEQMSLSKADLLLNLSFENPNGFGLHINELSYSLEIDRAPWASGTALNGLDLAKNKTTELQIPVSVNITNLGLSAYRMLQGDENPDYKVTGSFSFTALHELLGRTDFDFVRSGQIPLLR